MKKPLPVGTMGLLVDNKNPALKYFPSEFYSTPQWWDIVMNSHLSVLDNTNINPIVQMIDNFERNHRLGLLYEFKVDQSNILVCTCPLYNMDNSRASKWLEYSLKKYMESDNFKPEYFMNIDLFKHIING